jgi:hypothetical protein
MVAITALWIPILLSAVLVFVASSVIHMLLGYHAGDMRTLPQEERIAEAFRGAGVEPGDYAIPHAASREEWSSPEFAEKMRRGPVATMTVRRSGDFAMGPIFIQWFVFCVIVSALAAYVTGRAVGPGAEYLEVFRFAGTTTFIAHGIALWGHAIWFGRRWSTVLKYNLDALIYALLTAGVFGWLWPG